MNTNDPSTMPTRRQVLVGIASTPISSAIAGEDHRVPARISECPVARVVRIAKELSEALDDFNADAYSVDYGGEEVGIWIASVWPSRITSHVCLTQEDIPVALARFAARSS